MSRPQPRNHSRASHRRDDEGEEHGEGGGERHHGRELEGVGGEAGWPGDVVADDRRRDEAVCDGGVLLLDEARRGRLQPERLLGHALADREDGGDRDEGHQHAEHEPASSWRRDDGCHRDGEHDVEGQCHDEPDGGEIGIVAEPFEVVDGRGHGDDDQQPHEQGRASDVERPARDGTSGAGRYRGRPSTTGTAEGRGRRRGALCSDLGSAPSAAITAARSASNPRSLGVTSAASGAAPVGTGVTVTARAPSACSAGHCWTAPPHRWREAPGVAVRGRGARARPSHDDGRAPGRRRRG